MEVTDFVHILNPNKINRSSVKKYFKEKKPVAAVWVDRDESETHLETVLQSLLSGKPKRLAIWGGDGTVSRVIQFLFEQDSLKNIQLAIVPVGTGNDFARAQKLIGRTRKWATYFQLLRRAQTFDLGLLEVGKKQRIFFNNAGFGRDASAKIVHYSNPVKDIFQLKERKVQLDWFADQKESFESRTVLFGLIFNSPFFNRGLFFDDSISSQDGKISCFFIPASNRFSLVLRFLKGRFQHRSLARANDIRIDADSLTVTSKDLIWPQVDGEWITENPVSELKFSILPKSVQIFSS